MHVSSHDNMRRCIKRHVLTDPRLSHKQPLRVLDVARSDADGSYRSLFGFTPTEYETVDPTRVPVASDPTHGFGGFPDASFDVVVTGRTLEHLGDFWSVVGQMARVLGDDGVMIVITPSAGTTAAGLQDCYRFLPDSLEALAASVGLHVVEAFQDPRGPWRNQVGVFRRTEAPPAETTLDHAHYMPLLDGALQNQAPADEVEEHELNAGSMIKLPFLRRLHQTLAPRFYFEIGVFDGASLRLTECPAIGVDPDPCIVRPLQEHQSVHTGISADFFAEPALVAQMGPLDLSYIDGMHLIENAFEDFVNVEAHSHPLSVILVDDIYPNHPQQGLRSRASRHWTGDVWKIIDILRTTRPDLVLIPVDTFPTGTLVVLGADPSDTTLMDDWDVIVSDAIAASEVPPAEILERTHALHPEDPLLWKVFEMIRSARESDDPAAGLDRVRRLVAGAYPRKVTRS